MTALTDIKDVINRYTGGNSGAPDHVWWYRDARVGAAAATAPVANQWHSLWQYNGIRGGGGSAPGSTARQCDNTTVGAIEQTDPAGGAQKWITAFEAAGCQSGPNGVVLLYDRLADVSGMSGLVTTAQTISGSLTPSRYTGGAGLMLFLEIYTIVGTTATTVTVSYTNESGTSGRTTTAVSFGGTGLRETQRLLQLPLQAGDFGVRSVQSVTLAGSTVSSAGDFGVTLGRPLAALALSVPGLETVRDFTSDLVGTPEVLSGACLTFAFFANTVTACSLFGGIHMIEKV